VVGSVAGLESTYPIPALSRMIASSHVNRGSVVRVRRTGRAPAAGRGPRGDRLAWQAGFEFWAARCRGDGRARRGCRFLGSNGNRPGPIPAVLRRGKGCWPAPRSGLRAVEVAALRAKGRCMAESSGADNCGRGAQSGGVDAGSWNLVAFSGPGMLPMIHPRRFVRRVARRDFFHYAWYD
jgi:hypothetical protein